MLPKMQMLPADLPECNQPAMRAEHLRLSKKPKQNLRSKRTLLASKHNLLAPVLDDLVDFIRLLPLAKVVRVDARARQVGDELLHAQRHFGLQDSVLSRGDEEDVGIDVGVGQAGWSVLENGSLGSWSWGQG